MNIVKKLEITKFIDENDFTNYSLHITTEYRVLVISTRSLKKLIESIVDTLLQK